MSRAACALTVSLLLVTAACRSVAPTADSAPAAQAQVIAIAAPPSDWRALHGRRVRIAAPLTVSGNHEFNRSRALIASFGGRLFAPTERAAPGAEAAHIAAENARRRLVLVVPDAGATAPRSGSVIVGAQGIVEQRDGEIRLQLDTPPRVRVAARPQAPRVAGDVRLASLNLENLFNGDGRGGGFPTARGARTAAEYARQLGKLVATLRALAPDIVALMELENDGDGADSSLAQLVDALNAGGEGGWRFVRTGSGPGDDQIRVGLLYRADRVTPVGQPATLTGGPFEDLSRVPLAQTFRAGNGPAFTVVASHFKSKGCSEVDPANRDRQDGQACWNATRSESARRLGQWLQTDPTRSSSDLTAILGDLNAYAQEEPLRELVQAGWRDAYAQVVERPYSYVYEGQAGRLDHALLSPALAARLAGVAIWHSNADEAQQADRDSDGNVGNRAANGSEQTATPWRSSDHDPLLIGLRLRSP